MAPAKTRRDEGMNRHEDAFRVLAEDGSLVEKALEPDLPDAELERAYRAMSLTRRLDERCMILQRQGRLGFYGPSTGEEAAAIGSALPLTRDDWLFPALRQSGALLMRGFTLEQYFLHMFGKAGSVERGRSMPMHFSSREQNVFSWSSCMATQLPHAVGAAYAMKVKRTGQVAMGYMGDGATSESDFHVAMNFAGVQKAPIVFFCNNNQWAISVPFAKQTASATIAQKAVAYGFDGVRVDGNDVLACYAASRDAVAKARRGDGPTLIEAVTYRMQGHSSSDDPTRYRDQAEVDAWAAKDPLARYRKYLEQKGLWDDGKEAEMLDALNADITAAIRAAEDAPAPEYETLVTDVYADVPWHLKRQLSELEEVRYS